MGFGWMSLGGLRVLSIQKQRAEMTITARETPNPGPSPQTTPNRPPTTNPTAHRQVLPHAQQREGVAPVLVAGVRRVFVGDDEDRLCVLHLGAL